MPRLLLVDDNPSIHRIAESLLAPTAIELVCVDSAAEALERIANGEKFDVALVDTAMPGMDGWQLLERLRSNPSTSRIPIALMAGVLDPVDPEKLANAHIQGFLKKPIELRELGDRVQALLNTPVSAGIPTSDASPLSTVPAMKVSDLAKIVDPLPEYRPTDKLPDLPVDDLLMLSAADLFPEEAIASTPAPEPAPASMSVDLELEELDLDTLQGIPEPSSNASTPPAMAELHEGLDLPEIQLEEISLTSAPDATITQDGPGMPMQLPDTETYPGIQVSQGVAMTAPFTAGAAHAAAVPFAAPMTSSNPLVQQILSDPALVEALAKAMVAHLGEQTLKEVAWEVMPELAAKLQR